ncbi:hypothetical protein Tco_0607635 [Tanacetum coccineum]
MAAAGAYDEIEEVNANCTLKDNSQQASILGTQTDSAPVYDSDGSTKLEYGVLPFLDTAYWILFPSWSEEQYTELLEPIPKPHQVQQNDSNVTSAVSSVEQNRGTVEQHPATIEETQTASFSKSISIPNEEFSDDTTPSVARKFLNKVKSTNVTLQRVVKQKMTLDIHNWSSTAHQEIHKIIKVEIFPIVNQVDARLQNFKIQFLKEATKFVRDFKSLAKEADESLAKHKALEFEIKRLLRAVVSQDIMSIVQSNSIIDTSNLQTKLDHTLDSLSQKLDNENVELKFQAQTKTIIDSLQNKLHDTIYENAKLRAQLFDKVFEQKDTTKGSNKEDPWHQQQVIEGCRDKEKKGFHVLVFQTEAGFLDRQQESIKEFLRILEVHVSIAV